MSNDDYYWTTFCFKGLDPNDIHCTHKFLGALSHDDAKGVASVLSEWFARQPLKRLALEFDRQALFGKDGDIPVLLATENTAAKLGAFDGLRAALDNFRVDDFAEYRPHVTTPKTHFVGTVAHYALMRGKKPVRSWTVGERLLNAGDIKLAPIKEHVSDFDELELEIIRAFRKELYGPILKALGVGSNRLVNTKIPGSSLKHAINAGVVSFRRGVFKGTFSAAVSKELRSLGATWDKKQGAWALPSAQLPKEIRLAINASDERFNKTLDRIDDQLRQILPAEIADKVKSKKFFESSLWKTDRKIDNTLKSISVLPKLTDARREKIASEWQYNLDLWIKDFAAEEIPKLREQVQASIMRGGRYEELVSVLQKSYGVTQRKAKFLARQETGLLMAKYKEARYADAGVYEYEWGCVAGSKNHPVRPSHLVLKGKVFRFDNPPVTTAAGEPQRRNNPGEDYNCRCFARPILRRGNKK